MPRTSLKGQSTYAAPSVVGEGIYISGGDAAEISFWAFILLASAPSARAQVVRITVAPPAPRVEVRPPVVSRL